MKELKINFVIWDPKRSGGTRVIAEVAKRLQDKGHKITILALRKGDFRWANINILITYIPSFSLRICEAFFNRLNKFANLCVYKWLLKAYVKSQISLLANKTPHCDINMATYFPTAYAVTKSKKGIPFYYVLGKESIFCTDEWLRNLAIESYRLPLNLLVISKWLEDEIGRIARKQVFYVGCAILHNIFFLQQKKSTQATRRVMAFIRGQHWKGEDDLLQSLQLLEDVKIILVGIKKAFIKKNKKLKLKHHVEFYDSPDDATLLSLYSSADVFVYPSLLEGFGLPPLEAMACGTPVVLTDSKGVMEYAQHEYNSLITPPKDPESLAKSINRVLTDKKLSAQLVKGGLETVKKYDFERIVENVERVCTAKYNEYHI